MKAKRILAALLALAMLLSLAACSQSKTETPAANTPADNTPDAAPDQLRHPQ